MKRLSLYTALLTILFALVPSIGAASEFDGFYTGLSLGGAFRSGDGITNTSLTVVPGDPVSTSLSFDVKRNSFLGVLSAGYGCTWCCDYYLGLEGYISLSNYNRTSPVSSFALSAAGTNVAGFTSIRTKLNTFEFGLDIRPGYILCPDTMLYGRVGVAFNRLTIDVNSSITTNEAALGSGSLSLRRGRNIGALRLGLGLERRFWDCFAIRADYIYTWYGKISVTGSNTVATGGGGSNTISNTTKLSNLYGNAVMLGLFYYW